MRLGFFLLLAVFATIAAVMSVAQSTTAAQSVSVAQSATSVGSAQKTSPSPNKNKPKGNGSGSGNGKTLPGITPEREAAVMTFVKQHHPELSELLIHLKEHTPKEYDRAVRDLFRTSERLAQVQERDSQAYELELKLWKARSRAQLLAARLQMGDSEELRKQLRATLNDEYDTRLELLRRDHERATERMKNLGDQIDKLGQRRNDEIEKQLKMLTAGARGESKTKPTAKKKPGNK